MEKDILQQNFAGFLSTPFLWKDSKIYGLEQFVIKDCNFGNFTKKDTINLRLGKLVEQFVFHQLRHAPATQILAENLQIQDGKRTIGELDALLMTDIGPVHLEIIYKFYLYDPDKGVSELERWIGPNRKDNLLQKLDKLKTKQLPLLHHSMTQPYLADLNLNSTAIKQQVHFKAQLFLPVDHQENIFPPLNVECVKGFYIRMNDVQRFNEGQFYIPAKKDWLMDIQADVHWVDYDDFLIEVRRWTDKQLSPMCWLKLRGVYSKFFVVWW